MRKLKWMSLMMAMLLVLGLCAGASADGEKTLRVMWWGNQVRNQITDDVLKLFASENPEVAFESEFSDFSGYWDKLATLAAGNSLPDVMQMNHIYLNDYVSSNQLLDLTPYIEDGTLNLDNVSDNMVQTGTVDGKVYAISLGTNSPSMIYNTEVVADAGVEITENMGLDAFLDACRTIFETTGVQTNLAYGYMENFAEFFVRDRGYVLYEDDKLGVPDATVFEELFQMYQTACDEGWHMDPTHFVELSAGAVETDPLVTGKAWQFFCFSNQLGTVKNAAPDKSFAITTWPSDNPEAANYLKPALFFCVSANSANPAEAVQVVDFFTNSIEANEILLAERGVPVSSVVADTISPLLDESKQEELAFISLVTETSSPMNPVSKGKTSEVNTLINNLMEQMLYGQITPAEAAQTLFDQGNTIMAGA